MKDRILLPVFCLFILGVHAQSDTISNCIPDSAKYFTDYSDLLSFKPYLLVKMNSLNIHNGQDKLLLSPNSPVGLGLGFNFKFAGISLGFGLLKSQGNIKRFGKTKRLDVQGSMFTRNLGFDGHFQLYKGYYNRNPGDFTEWNRPAFPQLPDMKTISFGASGYYVLNNKRYSNKAVVVRTQKQKRSVGSLLIGIFFNYDEANSPGGFFPGELPDSIANDFDLKGFRYIATGLSIGYAYTWVITKSFFLNISVIPGGGYKDIRIVDNSGLSDVERHVHGQVQLRGALGYEHKYFFAGFTGSTLIRNMKYKNYELDLATEQFRIFIGKRFDVNGKK